jgi:hypothetical protein
MLDMEQLPPKVVRLPNLFAVAPVSEPVASIPRENLDDLKGLDIGPAKEWLNGYYFFNNVDGCISHITPSGGLSAMAINVFKSSFNNFRYINDDGKYKYLGDEWLKWNDRRTISEIVYDPSPNYIPGKYKYNRWHGWAITPIKGNVDLFVKDYMLDIICAGDDELLNWVCGWLAQMFQDPVA